MLLYKRLIQKITDIIVVPFPVEALDLLSAPADHYYWDALHAARVHDILILIHIDAVSYTHLDVYKRQI